MRIIDCFPYFNEKELLELRIRMLDDHVDQFIITEADRTNTGLLKPFTCKKTLENLGLMSDKITVLELSLPSKDDEPSNEARVHMQRDAQAEYITGDTIAFVSDVDEIINPHCITELVSFASSRPEKILHIPMYHLASKIKFALHYLGEHSYWCPAFVCMPHHIENTSLSNIREHFSNRKNAVAIPFDQVTPTKFGGDMFIAGWHFTWMGGNENMMLKYKSFQHYDDGMIKGTPFTTPQQMIDYMRNYDPFHRGHDIMCRPGMTMEEFDQDLLPDELFKHPHIVEFLSR